MELLEKFEVHVPFVSESKSIIRLTSRLGLTLEEWKEVVLYFHQDAVFLEYEYDDYNETEAYSSEGCPHGEYLGSHSPEACHVWPDVIENDVLIAE